MARHDRSHGEHHTTRPGGGKITRRSRTPGSGYDPAYRRADWNVQPLALVEMGRKGGSGATAQPKPQQPKPQPKGGSKPGGTVRRRVA